MKWSGEVLSNEVNFGAMKWILELSMRLSTEEWCWVLSNEAECCATKLSAAQQRRVLSNKAECWAIKLSAERQTWIVEAECWATKLNAKQWSWVPSNEAECWTMKSSQDVSCLGVYAGKIWFLWSCCLSRYTFISFVARASNDAVLLKGECNGQAAFPAGIKFSLRELQGSDVEGLNASSGVKYDAIKVGDVKMELLIFPPVFLIYECGKTSTHTKRTISDIAPILVYPWRLPWRLFFSAYKIMVFDSMYPRLINTPQVILGTSPRTRYKHT